MSAAAKRRAVERDAIADRLIDDLDRIDLDGFSIDRIIDRDRRAAARVDRGMKARAARIAREADRRNNDEGSNG
jgi:hypothetical protein